jgi:hypothetical protein
MAQTKAILDKLLTQASSMYIPDGFVCEQVLPLVTVKEKSGKLAGYGTNHLRIENAITGGRGEYRRVESIVRSQSTYYVDSHGLEDIVTPDDYDNVQEPYEAEEDCALALASLLYLGKEKSLADALTSTSIIAQNSTLSGTDQYSDYNNSDPVDDFSTARATVKTGCGMPANKAVMDWSVANKLRYHPQILDAMGFKDSRPGGLTFSELALALGVDKVLIANAMYESAKEGQTSSLAPVWGKHIVFFYAPDTASKRQVSLGYRVQLSRSASRRVYKYDIANPPGSKGIICDDHYDQLLSKATAAYLLKDVIA